MLESRLLSDLHALTILKLNRLIPEPYIHNFDLTTQLISHIHHALFFLQALLTIERSSNIELSSPNLALLA